jgi:hypothetical protein
MYPGRRFALPWAISFCHFGAGASQPYHVGTVPSFSTQRGTIVANPRRLRGARVVSSRSVDSSSSNPSPCWRQLDSAVRRPRIRSCRRRSRTLRRGSVATPGRSGNSECPGPRDARLSAPGCPSDSFPNRCPPSAATAFPRACEAHRSGSATGSPAKLV